MKVLLKQGECGIKDVTTIYSSDIEDLKEETEGADAAIGLLGPIFLTFLRKTNLVGLLLLPPMLIAIGICLVFDWSMSCDGAGIAVPIRLWFKIKMSADVLNFFFRLYIECKYRGYRNHADAVDEIEAKHEELEAAKQDRMDEDGLMDSMQSVAIMKRATAKLKQSAASGLVALQAYDDITRSWTYFFFQVLKPFPACFKVFSY